MDRRWGLLVLLLTAPIGGCTGSTAAPIQKSRDWLEPPLKKSAAKARPAAAAPKATGQRIGREANRARGRIQESLPIVRTTRK